MSTAEGESVYEDHSYSVQSASIRANETTSPVTDRLDAVICRFLQEQRVPGATLAIARDGLIVYQQGYGVAGAGRRMTAATGLRVASISKTFTAIAVLRLCEEGRLSLNAKVFGAKGLLKQYKMRGDKRLSRVTVRHLLQHSGGWDRDMAGDAVFWKVPCPPGVATTSPEYNTNLLQYVLNRKLQFTPGSRHAYSNFGFLVLGKVVEKVTGQSYEDYLTSLLSEIGVTTMYVGHENRVHWQSAEGEYFNIKDPAVAPSMMPDQEESLVLPQYGSFLMKNTGSFGGWVASAADILTVFCSLEGGKCSSGHTQKVLSSHHTTKTNTMNSPLVGSNPKASLLQPETIGTMLERPSYETGRDWYGLGLDVQDWGHTWGHTGAMEGTCSTALCHNSGVSWAFLLNAWAPDVDLDGVVKFALSLTPHLSPFPGGVTGMSEGGMLRVTSQDLQQRIIVHLPRGEICALIKENELQGFEPEWAGVNCAIDKQERESDVTFNLILSKSATFKKRKLIFDVELKLLRTRLDEVFKQGFKPEFITTYVTKDQVLALAIFSPAHGSCVQKIDIGVPAKEYVQLLNRRRKCGFQVSSQSVSHWQLELLITAIMVKDETEAEEDCVSDKGDGYSEVEDSLNAESVCLSDMDERTRIEASESTQLDAEGKSGNKYAWARKKRKSPSFMTADECPSAKSPHISSHMSPQISLPMSPHIAPVLDCRESLHPEKYQTREREQTFWDDSSKHDSTADESEPKIKTDPCENCNKSDVSKLAVQSYQSKLCLTVKESELKRKTYPCKKCHKEDDRDRRAKNNVPKSQDCNSSPQTSNTALSPTNRTKLKQTEGSHLGEMGRKWSHGGRVATLSWVQMAVDSFVTELGRQAKRRAGLVNVQFYPAQGDWFVSGAWSPDWTNNCYHRMSVSHLGLLPALAEAATRNVYLRFMCQYEEEGEVYYALFWDALEKL